MYRILDNFHLLVKQLVYYRVYNEDGEVESLQHFNTADNSLGRISIASITPPHTIVTLKHRLAGAESIDQAQMASMKLFKDITGQDLIKDDDDDPFLRLTGRSESRPMALIRPPRSMEPASDTAEVCVLRAFGAKSSKYLNSRAA